MYTVLCDIVQDFYVDVSDDGFTLGFRIPTYYH